MVPLSSGEDYSQFIVTALVRSTVLRSTVSVWSDSPFTLRFDGPNLLLLVEEIEALG